VKCYLKLRIDISIDLARRGMRRDVGTWEAARDDRGVGVASGC